MSEHQSGYRQIAVGQATPDAVTVGIEAGPDGQPKAAVWWEAKGDIDADEAEYANVPEASPPPKPLAPCTVSAKSSWRCRMV